MSDPHPTRRQIDLHLFFFFFSFSALPRALAPHRLFCPGIDSPRLSSASVCVEGAPATRTMWNERRMFPGVWQAAAQRSIILTRLCVAPWADSLAPCGGTLLSCSCSSLRRQFLFCNGCYRPVLPHHRASKVAPARHRQHFPLARLIGSLHRRIRLGSESHRDGVMVAQQLSPPPALLSYNRRPSRPSEACKRSWAFTTCCAPPRLVLPGKMLRRDQRRRLLLVKRSVVQ